LDRITEARLIMSKYFLKRTSVEGSQIHFSYANSRTIAIMSTLDVANGSLLISRYWKLDPKDLQTYVGIVVRSQSDILLKRFKTGAACHWVLYGHQPHFIKVSHVRFY